MRLNHLLPTLLAIPALSSPVAIATPGEIVPGGPRSVPNTATWYCTFSYELVFDHYVLEGHKWGASEAEVKALIPGKVTDWHFEHVGDGWSDFMAEVSFLPSL
jgi:hypothetical protein